MGGVGNLEVFDEGTIGEEPIGADSPRGVE